MCPALILATSRIERVIGRTHSLTVSTKTKNGFNAAGAPPGRRLAAADEGLWEAPEIIKESQRGRPKDSLTAK